MNADFIKKMIEEGKRNRVVALVADMKKNNAMIAQTYFEDQRCKQYQVTYFENAAEIDAIEKILSA